MKAKKIFKQFQEELEESRFIKKLSEYENEEMSAQRRLNANKVRNRLNELLKDVATIYKGKIYEAGKMNIEVENKLQKEQSQEVLCKQGKHKMKPKHSFGIDRLTCIHCNYTEEI